MPGAEEYFLPGDRDRCVVLTHGYTGTPAELRLLGDHLNRMGFPVLGVLLPGHGTRVEDLAKTTFSDWVAALREKVERVERNFPETALVGTSMGASVSLQVACGKPVDRVVTLSAPIHTFHDEHMNAADFCDEAVYAPKPVREFPVPARYYLAYDRYPLRPLATAFREIRKMEAGSLKAVRCPILIMQSRVEKTVRPESAEIIYNQVGSRQKEIAWFDHSGHLLAIEAEREKVFDKVGQFLLEPSEKKD